MLFLILATSLVAFTLPTLAAGPSFSGVWTLDAAQSAIVPRQAS